MNIPAQEWLTYVHTQRSSCNLSERKVCILIPSDEVRAQEIKRGALAQKPSHHRPPAPARHYARVRNSSLLGNLFSLKGKHMLEVGCNFYARGNQLPGCQVRERSAQSKKPEQLVDRLLMQTRPRCGDRSAPVNYDARGQESFRPAVTCAPH